jgi:hypothetical protein
MAETSAANGWHYRDMWDIVPATEFTNSAIHLTPRGTSQFASQVVEAILEINPSVR